ncbi:MAG: shikimate dehydrogenase [Methylococcales bacterium]|nr:shikimate dehydrogenase [Methylococcales bacterium]
MCSPDRYAVFGQPISHSKSPQIHTLFAQQTTQNLNYHAQEVGADRFETATRDFFAQGGKGLNCTVPLKELAYQFADQLTPRAEFAKAVNTLALQTDGSILGDNTDGCGLVSDLMTNHQITLKDKRILILGAGGASRGIISPIMQQMPAHLVIANRTVEKAIALAVEFQSLGDIKGVGFDALVNSQFDLIINATSASLSNQLPPLADKLLAEHGDCYDLAYSNDPTAFVLWGIKNQAATSIDGRGMLVEQAAEAFYVWRGVRPNTPPAIALLNQKSTV